MTTTYNAAAWLLDRRIEAGDGGRTAYVVDGATTDYAALQREVFRAQRALEALDVRRGERVALILDDELAFPGFFLGALRAGIVPVPLSTMLTPGELAAIVGDAGAGVAVVSSAYAPYVDALAAADDELRHAVVIGTPTGGESVPTHAWDGFTDAAEPPVAPTTEDSPAFWLYSSGTTGTPKGVMHRHGSPQATAETYAREVLSIGPDDRCLSVAKLFFAFGLGNSLTFPLAVGATAILNPRRPTPPDVAELVRTEQPTLFFASPGFVAGLLDADVPASTFASVRATITAGEALPADLQRRFAARFGHPVLDGIGTSEALHIFLSNRKGEERPGTSGKPVPGYDARLVDDAGDLVTAADTPGYLQVRGPSIATGYWSRDAATRAAFQGEWLATGDVYTRSDDGYWTFLGRNSDMIKAGGIWVSPAEVEAVLIEHPDVLEAAVVGARDASGLEQTVAFLVPRQGSTIDPDSIDGHCRARMAAFKRPRRIDIVTELPKTATGKIQRFALRDRLKRVIVVGEPSESSSERTIIDGVDLDVEDRDGDEPAIVLLHEGLGSIGLWRDVPEVLHDVTGRRTVTYSRAGYGRSGPVPLPRPLTYMHHEADVVLPALLGGLGIERPVLIGHSDGASIALLAAGAGLPVAALVLLAPHVIVEDVSVTAIAAARTAYAETNLRERLARHHDDVDVAFRGWNDAWLDRAFRDWDITDRLPGITAPVLAIQGADDPYGTTRQLDLIAAGVRGPFERMVLADVGHAPHLEAGAAVLAAVVAVIAPA